MAWSQKFPKQTVIPQHEAYNYPKQENKEFYYQI